MPAVALGRRPWEAMPASHALNARVCGRLTRSRTRRGPWVSSAAAGPRNRIGTSWVGPNWALASDCARELSVPGTTTIVGDSECETPRPIAPSAIATTRLAASIALGLRIDRRASPITHLTVRSAPARLIGTECVLVSVVTCRYLAGRRASTVTRARRTSQLGADPPPSMRRFSSPGRPLTKIARVAVSTGPRMSIPSTRPRSASRL